MDVARFIAWCEAAPVEQRLQAARRCAGAFADGASSPRDCGEAVALLAVLSSDRSPKVRRIVSHALATVPYAPRSVMATLSVDVDAVALPVVAFSPVLDEAHLADLASRASETILCVLAERPDLSRSIVAHLARDGSRAVVEALLRNGAAPIARAAFETIMNRFGTCGFIMSLLAERHDLPLDLRETVLSSVAARLSESAFVQSVLGAERARTIASETGETGRAQLAHTASVGELVSFVSHLRRSGRLDTAFVLRQAVAGNFDLLVAAFVELSGEKPARIRGVLSEGRFGPFSRLAEACGFASGTIPALLAALAVWREITARNNPLPTLGEAARLVASRLEAESARRPGCAVVAETRHYLAQLVGEDARREVRECRLVA